MTASAPETRPATPPVRRAPPLWAMPLALAVVAAFFVPAVLEVLAEPEAREARRARRLHALAAAAGPDALTIAALGDSRLRSALPEDEHLEAALAAHGLRATVYVDAPSGRGWDGAAALERLIAARPDLLLIDADFIFYPPRRVPGVARPARSLSRVIRIAADRLRARLRGEAASVAPEDDELRELAASRSRWFTREPMWTDLLVRARAQGTRVVILATPALPEALAAREPSELAHVAQAMPGFLAATGAEAWGDPAPYPADHFVDGRHMRSAGRARHTRWLVDRLVRALAPAGPAGRAEEPRAP